MKRVHHQNNYQKVFCNKTAKFCGLIKSKLKRNQLKRDVLVKTLPGTSPPQDGKYEIH